MLPAYPCPHRAAYDHSLQYVILNLGISKSFQDPDFENLRFPAQMKVDYVRIYQRPEAKDGLTCDPPNRPTAKYITECVTPPVPSALNRNELIGRLQPP